MPCGSAKDKDSSHSDKNGDTGHCPFEDLDHSVLDQPFTLGSNNVKQILKCMQVASKEVKDLILNECNIIFECKICANLFRSLANFLYHKRCYCKKHICEGMLLFDNFEEETQTAIVQPEPPPDADPLKSSGESDSLPPVKNCAAKLVKSVSNEKSAPTTMEEPKNLRNKGAKAKEQVEDDGKKVAKAGKVESPMISRRTREKNSINISKRALRDSVNNEPPKKVSKSANRVSTTSKSSDEDAAKFLKESDETESLKETSKLGKDEPSKSKKEEPSKSGKEENSKSGKEEVSKSGKEEISKSGKEEISKLGKEEISKSGKEESNKSGKEETSKSGKEETDMLPPDEAIVESTSEIVAESMDTESESDQPSIKEVPKETECVKSSVTPSSNPLKKLIITRPKSLDVKNSSVLDSIQKNMNITNKIGFTKITNAAGKNLQCFPKIIFKTIDGNPHAVFQTTESSKSDSITLKTKLDSSVVSNKAENDKLIIVLKKDPADTKKLCKNQSEFHLTRRKRLSARNDCNVQDLRCLTCNTQFTSLKTLYFHMLSIHSKKRLYYPCPFCKTLFVQMYGVTRHLISIHNKTKEQINKLRDIIKKKSVWKKVDDATFSDEISSPINIEEVVLREEPKPEIKEEPSSSSNGAESSNLKTVIKFNKNMTLHQCSKCARVFGRKSSQVSHEKFCIMNAIKVETVDLTGSSPISPPPNVSFLSLSPKPAMADPHFHKTVHPMQQTPSDVKINARPKRGAEKQMHKDFVNSQTLKWRSANRVDTNAKAAQSVKKGNAKSLEKKVMNIMDVESLLCMKCNKVFSSFSNLRRHVAIHVGWTRFKCKYCDYQAYNKSQCWAHVMKAHGVNEEDLEKSIVSLNTLSSGRKPASSSQSSLAGKRASDVKVKQISSKANGIPKVKINRKKVTSNYSRLSSDKKTVPLVKKGNLDKKEENKKVRSQSTDEKKEISYSKKDRNQHAENKKELNETKKEHNQKSDPKKVNNDAKKEKSQNVDGKKENDTKKAENKDVPDVKKEKSITLESKTDIQDIKRERTQSLGPVFKCSIPDYKKDASNYKSVTTNNPTTIILSKKFSAPTVQSFVTVSPESLSSAKTFPLRSSPRKIETKAPEEKKMTSLVTRSTAYSKGAPLQVKMSIKPTTSEEDLKKTVPQTSEKTYAKKDRLISEWFPKKDLNSNSVRRESAPLIIGLVPAASSGSSKSPVISYEKNSS